METPQHGNRHRQIDTDRFNPDGYTYTHSI